MQIVYDGECPFCARYVAMQRLHKAAGPVELVNARQDHPAVERVRQAGLDLNDGMALIIDDRIYFGADCMHRLALMSTKQGVINRVTATVFRSERLSRAFYPILRMGRNAALTLMRRPKI